MRFEYKGKTYQVEFERTYRSHVEYVGEVECTVKNKYPITTARIIELGKTKEENTLYRTGTVGCYHKESGFTAKAGLLEKGRQSALRFICRGKSLEPDFKKALWNAYHTRNAKPVVAPEPIIGEPELI